MGVISWLLASLRNRRYSMQSTNGKSLIFGTIYSMRYMNYKRDPNPLIFVLYSGQRRFIYKSGHYTDGINTNYLNYSDKAWFARMLYLLKKGNQRMNPRLFYRFLKLNRPNVIRTAYRRYHTSMISNPRMVSAGFTHLGKLTYPANIPWITGLNQTLEPQMQNLTGVQIAYSQDELSNRINQTLNSVPIQRQTVSATRSATTRTII